MFESSIQNYCEVVEIPDDDYIQESIVSDLKNMITKTTSNFNINKIWEQSKKVSKRKVYESDSVDDRTFKKIQEAAAVMRKAKTYMSYKNSFDKFCSLCHISTGNGVVIMEYNFHKGSEKNKNHVYVKYADGKYRMTIPAGSVLYHRSTNPNIKELVPVFKGKAQRGFLYDTPRVYLTIKEKMPQAAVDLNKKRDGSSYLYITKENIHGAYVDPLLRSSVFGAVYIETRNPIKVVKLTSELQKKLRDRSK